MSNSGKALAVSGCNILFLSTTNSENSPKLLLIREPELENGKSRHLPALLSATKRVPPASEGSMEKLIEAGILSSLALSSIRRLYRLVT